MLSLSMKERVDPLLKSASVIPFSLPNTHLHLWINSIETITGVSSIGNLHESSNYVGDNDPLIIGVTQKEACGVCDIMKSE